MANISIQPALVTKLLLIAICTVACQQEKPQREEPTPLPTPTLPDGRHFLADKPLKLFDKDKSDRLKLSEEMEQAKQRVEGYKGLIRNPALDMPIQAPTAGGEPISLEEATRGIRGKGPLKATIKTSLGTISCSLKKKQSPIAVAHFVALARGINLWWDGHKRDWSDSPFFDGRFVYKIQRGEALHLGLPPQAGDARIKKPMILAVDDANQQTEMKAYDIAVLRAHKLAPLHTNFLISAIDKPPIKEVAYPIGTCEPYDIIQQIAGKATTPEHIPLEEIVITKIAISR